MSSHVVTANYKIPVFLVVLLLLAGNVESNTSLQDSIEKSGKCIRCDLQNIDFSRRELTGINFSWSNLDGANFCLADLSNSIFIGASLNNTQFCGADLSSAIFSYASMENTHLDSAYIKGAIFSGRAGLYKEIGVFSEANEAPEVKQVFKISPLKLPKRLE